MEVYSKMDFYSSQISNLVEQLSHLPGIGSKSAQRLAFHILNMSPDQVKGLADAMTNAKKNVRYCKECCTYTDDELCPICANPKRNHKQIMVVENTRDLAAYEKTGKYEGVYHVLHGAISPMAGISPQDIRLSELMVRLQKDVDEVIVATNKTLEGDTTATYKTAGNKSEQDSKRCPYRWRFGIYRRNYALSCFGGTYRHVDACSYKIS